MVITKKGFLARNKVIFLSVPVGADVYLPTDVEIFYGSQEEALASGYTFDHSCINEL